MDSILSINNIETLLSEFKKIPKYIKEATYLEICKYPKRRFEEICSRILQFFLDPSKEHGFKELFLKSLFEILTTQNNLPNFFSDIDIITEDNAEGKRIDLLIRSKNFIIGIENKITAKIYNPLDAYKDRIEQYNNKNVYKIVLSLYKITDPYEISLIENNDFIQIRYYEYFNKVKSNMGNYISHGNLKYLAYWNDFMQTLENMENNMPLNEQLSNYFFDKKDEIITLIEMYDEYKNAITNKHMNRISELLERIKIETNDDKWWAWEKWDLGHKNEKIEIGIESYYEETRENICGKFHIYLTSWNLIDWKKFENIILNYFKEKKPEKSDDRAFLLVETINNDDEEKIIERLIYYYNYYNKLLKNKL
jgi:hypothetical protein